MDYIMLEVEYQSGVTAHSTMLDFLGNNPELVIVKSLEVGMKVIVDERYIYAIRRLK